MIYEWLRAANSATSRWLELSRAPTSRQASAALACRWGRHCVAARRPRQFGLGAGACALERRGLMNRGGALTLGAVLMLGGASGARGDDLSSLADATSSAASLPSWGGVFPRLPENWSDLPMQFKLSESAGYNSNVLDLATNTPLSGALARGDFQSISSYAASTNVYWGGQQLFADGSFGLTQYLHDVSLNTFQQAVDAGVNWTYASRCSGKLVASESAGTEATFAQQTASGSTAASPVPQQIASGPMGVSPVPQQIASTSINNVSTTGLKETAKCLVSGDYAVTFSSGVTQSTNSTLVNKPNDSRSVFVAAGISYNVTETNSLDLLATITGTDYTDRPAVLNNLGLAPLITLDQVVVTYAGKIGSNLSVAGLIGAVGATNASFTLALPSRILPLYSASATW